MGQVRRREFLSAAAALLAARQSIAQRASRQFRIGILLVRTSTPIEDVNEAILAGLKNRGYVLGQNLLVDIRYGSGWNQLSAQADELIALKPDVLVGTQVTSTAMKAKTSTIPIVLLYSADPVAGGLVKSLARPGTNVTGMSGSLYMLLAKQVELLTEIVPGMSRLAFLAAPLPGKNDPNFGRPDSWELAAREAADAKALTLLLVRAGDLQSLREAFAAFKTQRAEGLLVATNALLGHLHREIIDEVQRLRIPAASGYSAFANDGGLVHYGINFVETARYATKFIDRILRGTKPSDLPVEQVSQFELVLNQKAARELGLKVPPSILLRADRVIE
jgi:putative ABC transport system substrate-binding protein